MNENLISFENSVENDLLNCDFGTKLLDNYRLLGKIHESKDRQIFKLWDVQKNDLFILKAITKNTEYVWDINAIREIRHEKIAQIIDVSVSEKYTYIIQEYVKGIALDEYIKRNGPLSEELTVNIGLQLCDILEYFHGKRPTPIIYRDLKPGNIILTDDNNIKLIDLDSLRYYKQEAKKDTINIGTDGFASPEQFGFSQTDIRTDIYTFGATMYCLLTGTIPEKENFKIVSIASKRGDISNKLINIVEKCTAFNPDSRYQNIADLKRELASMNSANFITKPIRTMRRIFQIKMVKIISTAIFLIVIAFFMTNPYDLNSFITYFMPFLLEPCILLIVFMAVINQKDYFLKNTLKSLTFCGVYMLTMWLSSFFSDYHTLIILAVSFASLILLLRCNLIQSIIVLIIFIAIISIVEVPVMFSLVFLFKTDIATITTRHFLLFIVLTKSTQTILVLLIYFSKINLMKFKFMRKENSNLAISIFQFAFIYLMMLMIISDVDRTKNTFLYDVVSFAVVFIFLIFNNVNYRGRGILQETKLQLQNQNADLFSSSQQLQLANETLSKEIDEKSMKLFELDEQIKALGEKITDKKLNAL